LQNLCSQPRLRVFSAICSGSKSRQQIGHSKGSDWIAFIRLRDEEALALGSDFVFADGEGGGERPAACSVLEESSQKVSVNFSEFQW
jgi:hypothetical protein